MTWNELVELSKSMGLPVEQAAALLGESSLLAQRPKDDAPPQTIPPPARAREQRQAAPAPPPPPTPQNTGADLAARFATTKPEEK